MRAKTITDLLSLSVNLYLLSKDEDFLKELEVLKQKGKEKTEQLYNVLTGSEEGDEVIADILQQVAARKKQLEEKADEVAKTIYDKLHLVHRSEIEKLNQEIASLKGALERTESRLNELQQQKG